jgi:phosphoribosylformylglycinamidine cyclo-ligase
MQDGVNVDLGDVFSRFSGNLCFLTYRNCRNLVVHDLSEGLFRGPRFFTTSDLPPGTGFHVAPDGIGTKQIITDAAFRHRQSAHDWVAMCCGDITRYGGKPSLLVNDLSVQSLGENEQSETFIAARELMEGLKAVADQNGYVMYNGETAELGPCISSDNPQATLAYVWSGIAFGFFNPKNIITGKSLKVGQKIVALREKGFRSNGGSSVRKAFKMRFGDDWYSQREAQPYIQQAAEPSVLYDKFLAHINGWDSTDLTPSVSASLVVHLTGGSFRGKFYEDFLNRHGFSAILDDLYDPPEIMQQCGEWRGFDSAGFYDTFNGGQGAIVVMDEGDVDGFIYIATNRYGLEAKVCGRIMREDPKSPGPKLVIQSKFKKGEQVTIAGG